MTNYMSLTYNKIVMTMDKQKFCVLEASSNLVVIISLFENVEKAFNIKYNNFSLDPGYKEYKTPQSLSHIY